MLVNETSHHISPGCTGFFNTFACIIGAYDIFRRANEFWKENGKEQLFKVQLAGTSDKTEINDGLLNP